MEIKYNSIVYIRDDLKGNTNYSGIPFYCCMDKFKGLQIVEKVEGNYFKLKHCGFKMSYDMIDFEKTKLITQFNEVL